MGLQLPEQFSKFSEARQQGFMKVKKVKEDGGMVSGIFCTFTPLEILDAAGFTAVSPWGRCSTYVGRILSSSSYIFFFPSQVDSATIRSEK